MEEIKLVIFDMDGLLLDTETIANTAWFKAAENRNFKMTWEILRKIKGGNKKNSLNVLSKFLEEKELTDFIEEKTKIQKKIIEENGIKLKKGVLELLTFLKEKNIKKVVATSSNKLLAEKELKNTGIYKYFDEFIFGDEVINGKPNAEIFLKACEKIKISPLNSIVLEDSVLGAKAAVNAGIRCIVIEDTIKFDEEENKLPFKKFNDLLEVKEFLKNN